MTDLNQIKAWIYEREIEENLKNGTPLPLGATQATFQKLPPKENKNKKRTKGKSNYNNYRKGLKGTFG